jgi:endonuclease YncB( thermonuclease family)
VRLRSGETIRILNIDAPEITRAKCEAEAALGFRAKERLADLLAGAGLTLQRCDGSRCTDPYGRTLARLQADGRDLGEILISEGLATRWPKRFNGCGSVR